MNSLEWLNEFSFAQPWALLIPLLLLLPLLLPKLFRYNNSRPKIGAVALFKAIRPSFKQRTRKPILFVLYTLFVAAATIAAARPQIVRVDNKPQDARNLILALDVSRSMGTVDVASSAGTLPRINAVQLVVQEFIQARSSDRIGLVVFGSRAYVRAPLTFDHQLVRQFVDDLELGMAGDGTAVGDGLGISLKRLRDMPASSKAVILLTDGVSNSGNMQPLKAAEVAHSLGVKVHTIGVGSVKTLDNLKRSTNNPQSLAGAEYDEATMRAMAEKTGGVFFNASSVDGLRAVYAEIDRLESSRADEPQLVTREELFAPFASLALLALFITLLLKTTIFQKLRFN